MKTNFRQRFIPAALAALLVIPYPAVFAQNASSTTATSSGGSSTATANSRGSNADTATDDVAVQNLLAAAQALRESIQRLARTEPGEKRTEAIREGNEALGKVQSAIVALPPELLLADANESDYKKSLDKMRQASDRLHAAAVALANQPPGKRRNEAIRRVNTALLETNEAMLTGLQMSANKTTKASVASGSSSATGTSSSGAGGSATVTGRPGGNTVDLGTGSSGASK
jgi:hypothetical protein